MQPFSDGVRGLIRQYAASRYSEQKSVKDLLDEIQEEDPEAARQITRAFVSRLVNAQEDPVRAAHIAEVNRLDGVDVLQNIDPGLPFETPTFEEFDVSPKSPSLAEARDAVLEWVKSAPPGLIVLAGPPGVGKSHLAKAAAHHLAEREKRLIYRSEAKLLTELTSRMGGGREDRVEMALQEIETIPWLIIDEFGDQGLGAWSLGKIDQIINARWEGAAWCRTLITTNLVSSQMPSRIGSRLGDHSRGISIVIEADDYRRRQRR